jgi:uncharacterized protein YcbK (DUF882 family)
MSHLSRGRTTLRSPSILATMATAALAALAAAHLARPLAGVRTDPFAQLTAGAGSISAAADAFGASARVRMRLALPGDTIEFPLLVAGDPATLSYRWLRVGSLDPAPVLMPLRGARLPVPGAPGFYRLAVTAGGIERVIEGQTIAVQVPFARKSGAQLNGYRIGTYLAERRGGRAQRPGGFVEVHAGDLDLPVSDHLRLRDFISRDEQAAVWPKYVALDVRLPDKIELVLAQLRGRDSAATPRFDVHSGFRTPAHNARVPAAATDSRHQYGDALDVVIDADGDGRFTLRDQALVGRAVDAVESRYPELAGGLGLYGGRRTRTPYVHIDARGVRTRWRG